ncbi:helix-turn-helix transcriptional regulator [Ornithinimicrobium sp. LYQ92]|uniref:helix-turn-helix transcriptional regulator n=1 Tax=Serinicoccus sp. LYQ92 TaxID=3378798 RepID=UPI0038519144
MTTRLGQLIQDFLDNQDWDISRAQVAKKLDVSRQTVTNWESGVRELPRPENLRALASLARVPYLTVLNAALTDAGYLQTEELMGNAQYPAPITTLKGEPKKTKRAGKVHLPPRKGHDRTKDAADVTPEP